MRVGAGQCNAAVDVQVDAFAARGVDDARSGDFVLPNIRCQYLSQPKFLYFPLRGLRSYLSGVDAAFRPLPASLNGALRDGRGAGVLREEVRAEE